MIPQAAYDAFTAAFATYVTFSTPSDRALFFSGTACFTFPSLLTASLPALTVTLAAATGVFDLKIQPWHYLRAVAVNISLPANAHCRVFGVQAGCGTVLGISVLASYTTLFDRAQARVGFAPSTCSNSSGFPSAAAIAFRSGAVPNCAADSSICSSSLPSQVALIVGVTVGAVALVVVVAVLVYNFHCQPKKSPKINMVPRSAAV